MMEHTRRRRRLAESAREDEGASEAAHYQAVVHNDDSRSNGEMVHALRQKNITHEPVTVRGRPHADWRRSEKVNHCRANAPPELNQHLGMACEHAVVSNVKRTVPVVRVARVSGHVCKRV